MVELTLEEIREQAKRYGYRLLPAKKETLLACVCGCNRRNWIESYDCKKDLPKIILECQSCGMRSEPSTSQTGARTNWNNMISGLLK